MDNRPNINWFPGHMTKAIRKMQDNLCLVDAVVYVVDARAINSCNNPVFNRLLKDKAVLYVLNKCDLVSDVDLNKWKDLFDREQKPYVMSIGTSGNCSQIIKGIKEQLKDKTDKFKNRGANISLRAMVVGVPNSGKSTIINSMCKKAKAVTGNKPGVTRGTQWLSYDGVDFLDTPGTLWAKFDDPVTAHHLACIGSIKDEVLDTNEVVYWFINDIKNEYGENLKERYSLDVIKEDPNEIFEDIANKKGFKLKGGILDYERTSKLILDDFRKGRLGKIMLEKPRTHGLILKKIHN